MVILSASYIFQQYKTGVRILTGSYYTTSSRSTLPYGGLDLFSDGTFTRSTSGSFLMSAPTDGSTPFLSWSNPNIRRIEDRGDGLGSLLLMEGARTNLLPYSRLATGSNWTDGGTYTQTASLGPDGLLQAARNQTTAATRGRHFMTVPTIVSGTRYVGSIWAKRMASAGAGNYQIAFDTAAVNDTTATGSLSDTTYSRPEVTYLADSVTMYWNPWCGSAGFGGGANIAVDYLADLQQIEAGVYPSSPIWTTTVGATRAAEVLSYADGQYPASFLTTGFRFTFTPLCSSDEFLAVAGGRIYLTSTLLNNDYVAIVNAGGVCKLRIYQTNSVIVESATITWARNAQLTVIVQPSVASLTLAGFTTGNGTATGTGFAYSSGTLYIGTNGGNATDMAFGRFGRYIEVLPYIPVPGVVDLFSGGTFTRSSSGSYLIGTPTDGSTPFLAWANPNVRRIENQGDGKGDLLLVEGARTNLVPISRALSGSTWGIGTATITENTTTGVDGTSVADRSQTAAAQYSNYVGGLTLPSGTLYVASLWAKRMSGAGAGVARIGFYNALAEGNEMAIGETFSRVSASMTANGGAAHYYIPADGRSFTSFPGNEAVDYAIDAQQWEAGGFPSSPIWTTAGSATRAADALSYAAGQYPTSFGTNGFAITIYPNFLPADVISTNTPYIVNGFDGGINQGLLLSYSVAGQPRLFVANVTKQTGVFTWDARGQEIRIEVRPTAGTVTISGATTGNGVHNLGAWTLATTGIIYIGTRSDFNPTQYFYGRMGRYIETL